LEALLSGDDQNNALVRLTTDLVAAYISNNPVPRTMLSSLVGDIHASLSRLAGVDVAPAEEPKKPAVSIKKSITDEYIVCLDDGKKFKSLKRHLSTCYGMTPDEYRAKWDLPADYPMVAPAYAAVRSQMARASGLGRKPASDEPVAPPAPTPAKRRKIGLKIT
jgi:predicted transcriptional regulator